MRIWRRYCAWRTSNEGQRWRHLAWARVWLSVGVLGVVQYVHVRGFAIPQVWAEWVPGIFLMSAWALYDGDKANARSYQIEQKQDDQETNDQ